MKRIPFDAKLKIFQRQKRREKKIIERCFVQKESRVALKLVASRERHYTRLLGGLYAIFYCTSSLRNILNFSSRSIIHTHLDISAKMIHGIVKITYESFIAFIA